jgi:DNA-binding CsgD family transcriptional regulator/PAS domain-containing protein
MRRAYNEEQTPGKGARDMTTAKETSAATSERRDKRPEEAFPLTLKQASELIGAVYEGVIDHVPWSGLLTQLRGLLGSNWVTLILRPPSEQAQALIVNAGPGGVEVAEGQWVSSSIFTIDPMVNLPSEHMVTVEEMIGDTNWLKCEFYKNFVEPYDIRYLMGADIRTEEGVDCRFRVCRPPSSKAFSEADKRVCDMLLPHLRRAVQMHARLNAIESERRLFAATVDRMLVGTVILDSQGRIFKTNQVADEILQENDGLRLAGGSLQASYPAEDRELQRLIKLALGGIANTAQAVGQAMSITRPSGRGKVGVAVRTNPMSEFSEGKRWPAVTVFMRDPDRKSHGSVEVLKRLFGLTPAEALLSLQLVEGLTLDEAAEQLNIRKNTARAHLRSIFSKTNVTRQTSLVTLLLGSMSSLE